MDQTPVYLSEEEAEAFILFRKHQDAILKATGLGLVGLISSPNWKQFYEFASKDLRYGTVQVTFKDGQPVRVEKPVQTIIFGVRI